MCQFDISNSFENFNKIPQNYRDTVQFKNMVDLGIDENEGENVNVGGFRKLSFEEFKKTDFFKHIRNEEPIKNPDDLYFAIRCLNYWFISILPEYIMDYIFDNEDGPFLFLIDDENISIDMIESRNKHIFYFFFNLFKTGKLLLSNIKDEDLYKALFNRIHGEKQNKIACGDDHTAAIRNDGKLFCWGNNDGGQCNIPNDIKNDKFISVSCGRWHTTVIRDDGKLFCWGRNIENQCKIPTDIKNDKFIALSCGSWHTAAIREDGNCSVGVIIIKVNVTFQLILKMINL